MPTRQKVFFLTGLFMILSTMVFAADQLVFVTLITRHGDRSPFTNIKNANYKWKTPLEQLTPIGMKEEYMLGKKLRKRYVNNLKLLKPNYVDDSIYAVSSDYNRTIESAECLLTGLYPPRTGPKLENGKNALPYGIQPIPVRTVSKTSHLIMMPYLQYVAILKEYIYPSKVWQAKDKEYQPEFKEWTKILGNKITTLANILGVGDVLIVAEHHNKPLPKGLSKENAKKIIDLTSWGLATQFKSEKVSYLMGGELFNRIADNIKDAAAEKSKYKLVYYSGHDITILPIMSLLGVPLKNSPGYAANIEYELYKTDASAYIIKIRYNGNYVKLPIMDGKNQCTLEAFMKYVKEVNAKYSTPKAGASKQPLLF